MWTMSALIPPARGELVHRQGYGALRSQLFAGEMLLLAPTVASAAAAAVISPLRQLMWWSRSWGVRGLVNGALCSG